MLRKALWTLAAVLLVAGTLFLAGYLLRRSYGLLIPACILLGLGAGSLGAETWFDFGELTSDPRFLDLLERMDIARRHGNDRERADLLGAHAAQERAQPGAIRALDERRCHNRHHVAVLGMDQRQSPELGAARGAVSTASDCCAARFLRSCIRKAVSRLNASNCFASERRFSDCSCARCTAM